MLDFIVDLIAEIVTDFVCFWGDKVFGRFSKKKEFLKQEAGNEAAGPESGGGES